MDLLLDDSTGDLSLGEDGRLGLTSSVGQEVVQRLSVKLNAQLGEWFMSDTWGVRYFDDGSASAILVKNPNIVAIVAELKAIIVTTDGVASLTSFGQLFSASERTLTVAFSVLADDGSEIEGATLMGDDHDSPYDPEGSAMAIMITLVRSSCLV